MEEDNKNINSESEDKAVDFDKIFDSFEVESWGGEDIDAIKLAAMDYYCHDGICDK